MPPPLLHLLVRLLVVHLLPCSWLCIQIVFHNLSNRLKSRVKRGVDVDAGHKQGDLEI